MDDTSPYPDAGAPAGLPGALAKPVAGGLIVVLRVAQVALALSLLIMLLMGLMFLVPGSVMQDMVIELGQDGMPGFGKLALACFASALTAAAWFAVLHMLVKIVRTVQAGDPFVETNIGRLRGMWIVIAVTEVFRMVVHSGADIALSAGSITPAETGLDIRVGTWFLVLVIAVLSEAFRHGAEMRREQELTI